jgi:hypothetical protein
VSWHEPLPEAVTVMSAPRLPAAPPSGPDVATMSAGVHAATAEVPAGVAEGVLVTAGGALLATGEAVALDWVAALAAGAPLGVSVVGLHAAMTDRTNRT